MTVCRLCSTRYESRTSRRVSKIHSPAECARAVVPSPRSSRMRRRSGQVPGYCGQRCSLHQAAARALPAGRAAGRFNSMSVIAQNAA